MQFHTSIKTHRLLFLILIFLLVTALIADLFWGSVHIPLKNIIKVLFTGDSGKEEWNLIILNFRIPKLVTAILAGASLSVSGLQMQTMFRNPSPDLTYWELVPGQALG
jgi:iron complex transport system permease protein